jgi:hypothetical protein
VPTRDHARGGVADTGDEVALALELLALLGGEVLGADDVGVDRVAAPEAGPVAG